MCCPGLFRQIRANFALISCFHFPNGVGDWLCRGGRLVSLKSFRRAASASSATRARRGYSDTRSRNRGLPGLKRGANIRSRNRIEHYHLPSHLNQFCFAFGILVHSKQLARVQRSPLKIGSRSAPVPMRRNPYRAD